MHPCKGQSFTSKDGLRFTTLCVKDGTTTPPEHFVKLLPNTVCFANDGISFFIGLQSLQTVIELYI